MTNRPSASAITPQSFRMNRGINAEQDADYAKALTTCTNLADLRALVEAYAELAVDAMAQVAAIVEADWPEFARGLKAERRGKFAGEEWARRFGAILMPLPMMKITQIAAQFGAPFGVAWYRCKELRPDMLKVNP